MVRRRVSNEAPTAGSLEQPGNPFLTAMLETPATKPHKRNVLQVTTSVIVHIVLIGAAIIGPLYFTDYPAELKELTNTYLVAPPPPAPPPPPPVKSVVRRPRILAPQTLVAPRVIPKTIAIVKEPEPTLDLGAGVVGGVAGVTAGGALGGILSGASTPPPPPPKAAPPKIVRVGGDVKPPRLLVRVQPQYPVVARLGKVQGEVVIDAVINQQGDVVQEHAVGGPGLLIPAALQAVSQWKYAPTILDGQPVSVATVVTVDFQLHG